MSSDVIYRRQNSAELYCKRRLLIPGILLCYSNECLKISLTRFYSISRKRRFIYDQPLAERDSGELQKLFKFFYHRVRCYEMLQTEALTRVEMIAVWR